MLNPAQREAVETTEGPVLILAGAGTGKTRVITQRIAHLIKARRVAPKNILAVTFTNKAANEMRERTSQMLRGEDADELAICTFHALCVRMLRMGIERLGYKRNFTICDAGDQLGILRKVIVRVGGTAADIDPFVAGAMIGARKNAGEGPEAMPDGLMQDVMRIYQQQLKALNAVDFDDLLVLSERLLAEFADVREGWQRRFRYIMVDEFQDTNSLQMRLLRLLVGPDKNVCVVGDDDQSIYGWRGADISNILDFERYFPGAAIVKLEENYRSTNPILSAANHLIKRSPGRREKQLWSAAKGGEKPRLIRMPGEQEEADFIADEIWEGNAQRNVPWDDYAVLFRMNSQSRSLEQALRKRRIPYRVIGGKSFFDRREVKDVLSYLTVLANPDDDIALLRIINNPPRGIGIQTVEAATQHSIDHRMSVANALTEHAFAAALSDRARGAIAAFLGMLGDYRRRALADGADYPAIAEEMLAEIKFYDALKRGCKDKDEEEMRRENVRELIRALYDHRRTRRKKGLLGFLDDVALMGDKESDDIEKKKGVCLITLHASKGLEFPNVYLVGLEEGVLPHKRSIQEGTRDEERRLLYVGITRAQKNLTLTHCQSRSRRGQKIPCMQSSFIDEIDPALLDKVSYRQLAEQVASEEAGKDYFAMMKEMLAGD